MRFEAAGVLLLLGVLSFAVCGPEGVLVVKGRGAEGRPAYEGGKVEFLDAWLSDQVVHLGTTTELPLRLSIKYDVLETAPVLLNSRMGTEFWRLYQYGTDDMVALHTTENIDLSRPGVATVEVERATATPRFGELPRKGLVGIRGHYYFLIDQPDGEWLDVVDPPALFSLPEVGLKLTFTLANLNSFELSIAGIESTWQPGGPVRVKLMVRDADGERWPVVNCPATISGGDWKAQLSTQLDALSTPTGWLATTLPEEAVGDSVLVEGTVNLMTPAGPRQVDVSRRFKLGEGLRTQEQMAQVGPGGALPRNADGVVRETRALWVATSTLMSRESIDRLVDRAADAGLNVLIPDVFVRSTLVVRSELWPMADSVQEGLDPLAYLIDRAHEKGLEVHPWFCVTYRDRRFRDRFGDVDMIDAEGEVMGLGADVHRPRYRDFMVELMVGVARDYQVDGIHLDYIRTMGRCHCDQCKDEFARRHGKPLTEATDDEWIGRQREAIGDIVQRTAEGVRAVRPGAILSAAVFAGMPGGAAQGQDPANWAKQGWVDLVIPMDYQMLTLAVRANERKFLEALQDDDKLVTGLSLYQRAGQDVSSRPPELLAEQIAIVRGMGIHGYSLFADGHLDDGIAEMLKTRVNGDAAVPFFR